jgi:cbb3-type cytochrome oxidase maturation protein
MEIIFLLIIVSLVFVAVLAGVLFWAIRSGQFDDLEGHGHQILMDDDDNVINKDDNEPPSQ